MEYILIICYVTGVIVHYLLVLFWLNLKWSWLKWSDHKLAMWSWLGVYSLIRTYLKGRFMRRHDKYLKCIKSLYKSTYNGNAFDSGRNYRVLFIERAEDGRDLIFLQDNLGNEFNLSIEMGLPYYWVDEYFDVV